MGEGIFCITPLPHWVRTGQSDKERRAIPARKIDAAEFVCDLGHCGRNNCLCGLSGLKEYASV